MNIEFNDNEFEEPVVAPTVATDDGFTPIPEPEQNAEIDASIADDETTLAELADVEQSAMVSIESNMYDVRRLNGMLDGLEKVAVLVSAQTVSTESYAALIEQAAALAVSGTNLSVESHVFPSMESVQLGQHISTEGLGSTIMSVVKTIGDKLNSAWLSFKKLMGSQTARIELLRKDVKKIKAALGKYEPSEKVSLKTYLLPGFVEETNVKAYKDIFKQIQLNRDGLDVYGKKIYPALFSAMTRYKSNMKVLTVKPEETLEKVMISLKESLTPAIPLFPTKPIFGGTVVEADLSVIKDISTDKTPSENAKVLNGIRAVKKTADAVEKSNISSMLKSGEIPAPTKAELTTAVEALEKTLDVLFHFWKKDYQMLFDVMSDIQATYDLITETSAGKVVALVSLLNKNIRGLKATFDLLFDFVISTGTTTVNAITGVERHIKFIRQIVD